MNTYTGQTSKAGKVVGGRDDDAGGDHDEFGYSALDYRHCIIIDYKKNNDILRTETSSTKNSKNHPNTKVNIISKEPKFVSLLTERLSGDTLHG